MTLLPPMPQMLEMDMIISRMGVLRVTAAICVGLLVMDTKKVSAML